MDGLDGRTRAGIGAAPGKNVTEHPTYPWSPPASVHGGTGKEDEAHGRARTAVRYLG